MSSHDNDADEVEALPDSPLVKVLAMGGIGVWKWDLPTDAISCAVPQTDTLDGADFRFRSAEEFLTLASLGDREALATALREVARGISAIRHTFRLETDERQHMRIDAERFDSASSTQVLGILRADTDQIPTDSRLAALFDERDRVARALEAALLPPELPPVPGLKVDAAYRSSEGAATGDFYDVFPVGGGDWGLSIGDVGGHGPAAAAITTSVRYAMRAAALVRRNPIRVLAAANEAHLAAAGGERFTTCHFVRLRRTEAGLRIRVATAGHPDLVIKKADGSIEHLTGTGPMLGLMTSPDFVEAKALLDVGDILLAHTDGVTEARRADEMFGDDRVAEFLQRWVGPIDGFADALHTESRSWSDSPARDDMATVALQVQSLPDTPK